MSYRIKITYPDNVRPIDHPPLYNPLSEGYDPNSRTQIVSYENIMEAEFARYDIDRVLGEGVAVPLYDPPTIGPIVYGSVEMSEQEAAEMIASGVVSEISEIVSRR